MHIGGKYEQVFICTSIDFIISQILVEIFLLNYKLIIGGEILEWMILICFIYIIYYSSYPGKIKRLESKVKKFERNQRGVCEMSDIIASLIGKQCKIKTDEGTLFSSNGETNFSVLDADDEWIKLSYINKKHGEKIRVIRIDSISSIELISE
ncbi:Uncharacterised protein [[Clostridium] sordellii]|nr:Uncharacterised protein [[Clostridium] sordellii] [Paeniclostridium sordellii]